MLVLAVVIGMCCPVVDVCCLLLSFVVSGVRWLFAFADAVVCRRLFLLCVMSFGVRCCCLLFVSLAAPVVGCCCMLLVFVVVVVVV